MTYQIPRGTLGGDLLQILLPFPASHDHDMYALRLSSEYPTCHHLAHAYRCQTVDKAAEVRKQKARRKYPLYDQFFTPPSPAGNSPRGLLLLVTNRDL